MYKFGEEIQFIFFVEYILKENLIKILYLN